MAMRATQLVLEVLRSQSINVPPPTNQSTLFVDGFDNYTTAALGQVWTGVSPRTMMTIVAEPRTGHQSLQVTAAVSGVRILGCLASPTFAASTHVITGFAIMFASFPSSDIVGNTIMGFSDSIAANEIGSKIVVTSAGHLRIYRGSSAQTDNWTGTSLTIGTWYYIEVKGKYLTSASSAIGDVEVRVDYGSGPVVVNQLGVSQQTSAGSNSGWTNIYLGAFISDGATSFAASVPNFWIDDVYVIDITKGAYSDYLGNCTVETLYPAGVGGASGWTPSDMTHGNWANVNQVTSNGTLSSNDVAATVAGTRDSYAIGELSNIPASVFAVTEEAVNAATGGDTSRTFTAGLRIDAAYYDGAVQPTTAALVTFVDSIWEVNPSNGFAFTGSDVDALEAGIKLVS